MTCEAACVRDIPCLGDVSCPIHCSGSDRAVCESSVGRVGICVGCGAACESFVVFSTGLYGTVVLKTPTDVLPIQLITLVISEGGHILWW